MCIVAKRNVSSFEPLWCPLCQLSVSTQPATVEPLLYCLSLQSSNLYSGSVEAIESTESLPYGLQAFLFQYFFRGFIVSLSQQRSRPTCSLPIWIYLSTFIVFINYLSTFIVSINYLSTLIVSITPTTMSPPPLLCHEICPKYCTAGSSGQNFYTANFT